MENKKLIKISKAILIIGILIYAIGCVMNMVDPQLTRGIFEHYVGQSWSDFSSQQPRQAELCIHLNRMAYVQCLIGAFYALFILFTSYRSGNRSAWIVMLIGTVSWSCVPLVFGLIFSDPEGIKIGIVCLVVFLVPLGIGAKAAWSSKKM